MNRSCYSNTRARHFFFWSFFFFHMYNWEMCAFVFSSHFVMHFSRSIYSRIWCLLQLTNQQTYNSCQFSSFLFPAFSFSPSFYLSRSFLLSLALSLSLSLSLLLFFALSRSRYRSISLSLSPSLSQPHLGCICIKFTME